MAEKKEPTFSKITLAAREAALRAGSLLREGFGTHFSINSKSNLHDLVTEYDYRSEKAIIDFLSSTIPRSQFLAEESGLTSKEGAEVLWIIDPLDGTVNFAHHIPVFAVSIGAEVDGVVVSGVVYQPITEELFIVEKGAGAFLYHNNGVKKLAVSNVQHLRQSMIATGFPYNLADNPGHCIDHFVDILRMGLPIRRLGAAAIDFAYTAAGRFEGFFEVSLSPWDCAAGKLLVEEAGGRVTGWEGEPFDLRSYRPVFASNGLIHTAGTALLSRKVC